MKGPFSFWAFFGLTLYIDLITLFVFFILGIKPVMVNPYYPLKKVTIIIPIHNEKKEEIIKTFKAIYKENYPVSNVILCGGSINAKPTVYNLSKFYKNLFYVHCNHISKAKKINFVVENFPHLLEEFVYVRDCKVEGDLLCVERMMSRFDSEKVAAVTSYGRVSVPKGFLSRAYFYGKAWVNEIGRFRKNAQEKRNAVFVICGASTIFRKNILEKIPMPSGSKTEDTFYTWILQKNGYKINVADDAVVSAPEVDGKGFDGLKSQVKQSYRWSSGTIQCIYRNGRALPKNKSLFYTTILPGFIESIMYSIPLVLLPLLFFLDYRYGLAFLIGDTVFSLLGTLIIIPKKFFKTIVHYPEILFFKYVNALIFLYALFVVSFQAATNQTKSWSNEWISPKT